MTAFLIAALFNARAGGMQQPPGELHGTIRDDVGGVIVGATVTLTDARQRSHTITTDASGTYAFEGLAPGRYQLLVELDGFAAAQREVAIDANDRSTVNVRMRVAIDQRVEVVASLQDFSRVTGLSPVGLTLGSEHLGILAERPRHDAAGVARTGGHGWPGGPGRRLR